MSRRQRYKPMIKSQSTFFLNITSMTDMFTIMLVFLLQTYSTADLEIIPQKNVRLPSSNTSLNPIEGVRITLSEEALKIGEQTVASLKDRRFAASDTDAKDPNFLPGLFAELDKLAKQDQPSEALKQGRVLLQADARLPYETLRKVMYTASMAGFPQLKMVTMVGN